MARRGKVVQCTREFNGGKVERLAFQLLVQRIDVIQVDVRVANDANCFTLSEAQDGAAAGAHIILVDWEGGVRGLYETDDPGLDEIFHRSQHVLAARDD